MQFPVAVPNDGKVDLVIHGTVSLCPSLSLSHAEPPSLCFFSLSQLSRAEMLRGFDGAENGAPFWHDKVNLSPSGLLRNR
jgi:hypothetical protein